MKKLSPRMQLILSMLIFGTIGVFRRAIPYPSSVVALARSVIGLAFLLLVRAIRHEPVERAAVKRNLPKLLLLGAMLGFNWIFLFEAYNYTSVAAATMCYYMAPVFILLLSPIVFGEKITPRASAPWSRCLAWCWCPACSQTGCTGRRGFFSA